jgi:hypothetical protein
VNNVERLDLKIHDPEDSLRPKKRLRSGSSTENGTTEAGSEDDVTGIEAILIMKLVCKHGESCSIGHQESHD